MTPKRLIRRQSLPYSGLRGATRLMAGTTPANGLRVRRSLGAVAVVLVAALWAALAYYFGQSVGMTRWDDDCYAARPGWAVGQALIAMGGVASAARGSFMLVNPRSPDDGWTRPLGIAAIALAAWLLMVLCSIPLTRFSVRASLPGSNTSRQFCFGDKSGRRLQANAAVPVACYCGCPSHHISPVVKAEASDETRSTCWPSSKVIVSSFPSPSATFVTVRLFKSASTSTAGSGSPAVNNVGPDPTRKMVSMYSRVSSGGVLALSQNVRNGHA